MLLCLKNKGACLWALTIGSFTSIGCVEESTLVGF